MKGRKHLLHFSDDTTPDTPSESTLDLSLMSNDRHLVLGQREKEEEIQEEEEVNSLFLSISDVESAISLIISRISPSSQVSYPRIIFKHQLYPIIPNYTEVILINHTLPFLFVLD